MQCGFVLHVGHRNRPTECLSRSMALECKIHHLYRGGEASVDPKSSSPFPLVILYGSLMAPGICLGSDNCMILSMEDLHHP